MKAYKIDFDGKQFVKVTYDVRNERDFSNEPETRLYDSAGWHNCCEDIIDKEIDNMNKNLVSVLTENSDSRSLMVKACKDCGKYFIVGYDEFIWFKNRDLSIPVRCSDCRSKRKRKKNQEVS